MRRWFRSLILGVGLIAVLGGSMAASAAPLAPSGTPAAAATVAVEDCGAGAAVVKPASLILTCADDGEVAEKLVWTSWTATRATATGIVTWRTCFGKCGTRDSAAADVILSNPVNLAGKKLLFSTLTLKVTGSTPSGFQRDISFGELPTPTYSPAPSTGGSSPAATPPAILPAAASGSLDYAKIEGFWLDAGGPAGADGSYTYAQIAAAITGAESSFLPGNIQQGVDYCGSGSDKAGWGLWQITCGNSVPRFGSNFQMLDPWNNAEAAVYKCESDVQLGYNCFDPWTTYATGAYASYLQHTAPDTTLTDPGEYVQYSSTPPGTPASPAAAPGSTYGPNIAGGPTGQAHTCRDLGTYKGVQGDLCADLIVAAQSNGSYLATLRIEAFCQESGHRYVQCSGANLYGNTFNPGHFPKPVFTACGHRYGNCGTPRNYSPDLGGIHFRSNTCAVNTWGVVFANGPAKGEHSYIILPGSGHFLYLNSNLGTGHFNVCD